MYYMQHYKIDEVDGKTAENNTLKHYDWVADPLNTRGLFTYVACAHVKML